MSAISQTNSRLLYGVRPRAEANGSDEVVIKVRLRDADKKAISGRQVELYVTAGLAPSNGPNLAGIEIVQPDVTNDNGLAIGYIKSTVAGPVYIHARAFPPTNPEPADLMSCNNLPPDTDIVELDTVLGANFYNPPMPVEEPGPDTGRRIHLTWEVSRYNYHLTDGIRVRITATGAERMPNKVFAYLMLPLAPGENERLGAFDHVCSPTDLEEYPEDEPIADVRPEWFRLDYLDVILRSRAEVHAFVRDVAADVYRLKTTLDTADLLFPGGEIWFGSEPSSSSSSSSSSGA
jgi:hypothetical protein